MKLLVILLLVCISLINASPLGSCIGKMCKPFIKCNHNVNHDVSKVTVHFYDDKTNINKSFWINEAAAGILSAPAPGRVNNLLVFVGGFKSHIHGTSIQKIKNNFVKIPNSHLIIIDHSAYTYSKVWFKLGNDYSRSVEYVPSIGRRVAQLLADLTNSPRYSPKNIHCAGHSLGGQILGHVGSNFFNITGRLITRISALDPAGPCFEDQPDKLQVRSGIANFVEVYHCNDLTLGSSNTIADMDYHVNGGEDQPGCKSDVCSHNRCVDVWAKSAMKKDLFTAYRCQNYEMFEDKKCSKNHSTIAGFWNPSTKTAKGIYYFSTEHVDFDA